MSWSMAEFGLALDFGTERAPLHVVLDEYEPVLRLAEGYGFHSVVAGQSFPARPGSFHVASPFLALAALAPRTSLRLGTGVTLQPAWQPLNLAYDGAILDQLSGGRFFMGIAVANPGDWERFGMLERARNQSGQGACRNTRSTFEPNSARMPKPAPMARRRSQMAIACKWFWMRRADRMPVVAGKRWTRKGIEN